MRTAIQSSMQQGIKLESGLKERKGDYRKSILMILILKYFTTPQKPTLLFFQVSVKNTICSRIWWRPMFPTNRELVIFIVTISIPGSTLNIRLMRRARLSLSPESSCLIQEMSSWQCIVTIVLQVFKRLAGAGGGLDETSS